VRTEVALTDEAISCDQQYGAGGVEEGVEGRERSDVEHNLERE